MKINIKDSEIRKSHSPMMDALEETSWGCGKKAPDKTPGPRLWETPQDSGIQDSNFCSHWFGTNRKPTWNCSLQDEQMQESHHLNLWKNSKSKNQKTARKQTKRLQNTYCFIFSSKWKKTCKNMYIRKKYVSLVPFFMSYIYIYIVIGFHKHCACIMLLNP